MRRLRLSPQLLLVLVPAAMTALACSGSPASSVSGAGKRAENPGEPIAKIGDSTITVEQIQRRIDEQSPFVRARYTDPEKKKEFLDSQVRFEVLAAEAFARGMDRDPEVIEATKKIIVQKLTREEFDGRVKLQDVTDAELQKYFDEHQADYQKPEMVRVSDIAVAFGSDKAKARKTADEAQRKAVESGTREDPNHFKELAAQYSTDEATKRAGGDLRYLTGPELEEKLGAEAKAWAFSSETLQEVSPVFASKDAFHVVKRTGRRKEITRTFEQVKNQIKNVVYREKRTEAFNTFVEGLKQKHGVSVDIDKLDKVKVNAQMPPGVDPHGGVPGMDRLEPRPGFRDDASEDEEHGSPPASGGPPTPPPPSPSPTAPVPG